MATSHKRDTNARITIRPTLVAAPLAFVATASAVTMGVLNAAPTESGPQYLARGASGSISNAATVAPRREQVSRGDIRRALKNDQRSKKAELSAEIRLDGVQSAKAAQATTRAVKNAETRLWATTELNVWSASTRDAKQLGVVKDGDKVLVTGRQAGGREEIVLDGKSRWVTAGHLTDEKPIPGIGGVCSNGTSVNPAVSASIKKVHQAVCARFPQISTYGTLRSDGEHGQGRAVDIMISGAAGWEVAEFIRANYAELGVSYLIYSQKIWSVERSGEGWRGMSNRGSVTANHYDHVHVTVF